MAIFNYFIFLGLIIHITPDKVKDSPLENFEKFYESQIKYYQSNFKAFLLLKIQDKKEFMENIKNSFTSKETPDIKKFISNVKFHILIFSISSCKLTFIKEKEPKFKFDAHRMFFPLKTDELLKATKIDLDNADINTQKLLLENLEKGLKNIFQELAGNSNSDGSPLKKQNEALLTFEKIIEKDKIDIKDGSFGVKVLSYNSVTDFEFLFENIIDKIDYKMMLGENRSGGSFFGGRFGVTTELVAQAPYAFTNSSLMSYFLSSALNPLEIANKIKEVGENVEWLVVGDPFDLTYSYDIINGIFSPVSFWKKSGIFPLTSFFLLCLITGLFLKLGL